jgi:tRNA (cmo5U34)-methyltransferase
MNESSLGHFPVSSRWEFDESVARCFGDMLNRSIPLFPEMRSLVTRLARRYARPWTKIVDMGASCGGAIEELVGDHDLPKDVCFEAWEVAPAMLAELRKKWPQDVDEPSVRVIERDLRVPFGRTALPSSTSVMLSVLTLQFTPIEHRLRILRDVWQTLGPGGAFIMVEKVIGSSADIDELFTAEYNADKLQNGYTQDEIDRKRCALEGVLVPLTYDMNVQLLRCAGFQEVDSFWRCLNFVGFIAIK